MSGLIILLLWIGAIVAGFEAVGAYTNAQSVMHQVYAALACTASGLFLGLSMIIVQLDKLNDIHTSLREIESFSQHLERLNPTLRQELDQQEIDTPPMSTKRQARSFWDNFKIGGRNSKRD